MLKFPASEIEWYVLCNTQLYEMQKKNNEIFIMGESDHFAFQNQGQNRLLQRKNVYFYVKKIILLYDFNIFFKQKHFAFSKSNIFVPIKINF